MQMPLIACLRETGFSGLSSCLDGGLTGNLSLKINTVPSPIRGKSAELLCKTLLPTVQIMNMSAAEM